MNTTYPEPLRFDFIPDPERRGSCRTLGLLRGWWKAGLLVGFGREFGQRTEDFGNCHEVSTALLADLHLLGWDAGWRCVGATIHCLDGTEYEHTWLEHEGWAVDGSVRGLSGRVFVAPARFYRGPGVNIDFELDAADLLAMATAPVQWTPDADDFDPSMLEAPSWGEARNAGIDEVAWDRAEHAFV